MISVTKTIKFEAAHRLPKHFSKCKMLHGHSYILEATFTSTKMIDGMVIDFSIIKDVLGGWIKKNWDHNLILCKEDMELAHFISSHLNQKVYIMEQYPTAENMVEHLLKDICPNIFSDYEVRCIKIKLYETSSSYVELTM